MAACPPRRFSRADLRPPAGANPEVPGYAKGDHVLNKWVLEERARRRTFLADQVLEPNEPFPRVRHPNPLMKPFINMFESFNRSVGYRARPVKNYLTMTFTMFLVPAWIIHYMTKYHWAGTDKLMASKPVKYPEGDLAEHGHH